MENNKRIGLLTFHTPDNYGAVYQAYALQKYIKDDLKKNVEIIDFCTPKHLKAYCIFKKQSNNPIKNFLKYCITATKYLQLKKKKKLFEQFRKSYLKLSTKRYNSEQEFLNHTEMYDTYIVGSDQVFNPHNEYYKAYYLAFEKRGKRKIAYAPSFGISAFTDETTEKILPYLKDFDNLSCREKQGAEYISRIIGKEVPAVVDPVFLIGKEGWKELAVIPQEKQKYVFVYDLCGGEKLMTIAKSIAREKKLKVICATGRIRNNYLGVDVRFDIGPSELLGYINGAEYVVTDSFHGTSLSLIMEKKVVTYIALPHAANRITSITEFLGTSNQVVTDATTFNINNIHFKEYGEKLAQLVDASIKYLETSLK